VLASHLVDEETQRWCREPRGGPWCDVLRFMEYEHAVAEEYAFMPALAYELGRGRFLASLLAAPSVYRTSHFRERYEHRARTQIGALLRSSRYRSYRWLRARRS